jgi:Amt family ammonium transporter
VYSILFFEAKMKIDDPIGAISVHGVGGAWGVLSIGLLANGRYGAGWNGVHIQRAGVEIGVAGAFATLFGGPANDWSQLGAQAVGALTCLIFIVPMRCKREEEIAGLDLPEMGAECYPDFHLTDKGSSRGDS